MEYQTESWESEMITPNEELRKLAEVATPGPWAFGTFHRLLVVQADKHGGADKHSAIADIGAGSIPWDATAESMQEYNDAEYIAAANPAKVIDLLDQLQSQAERIKALEGDVEDLQEGIDEMCNAIPGYHWSGGAAELIAKCFAERDTLRAEIADAELHTKQVERGLDKATAQLAEIEKVEPVARAVADKTNTGYVYAKVLADKLQFGTNLYSHPMPAQGVEDAARYRWLRDYLISPSTHFDDLIVSADKAETLNGVIDAARAKGAK